jgi:Folate receptor family
MVDDRFCACHLFAFNFCPAHDLADESTTHWTPCDRNCIGTLLLWDWLKGACIIGLYAFVEWYYSLILQLIELTNDYVEQTYLFLCCQQFTGGTRISAPESNLVNCTWFASNSCCKRTEVTSVFGEMYPLHGATRECSNQLNYLMCYFCSPHQYQWYDR